eukprot:TRINITY_DN504_c0_g1_i1.p1 TRINITY_DN504_c0_g1~~TRINITY_DN504_c0_g1_i1.p1  ORF type:complete len:290 (-),score=94.49 TRINITY_DN504_c0_g1_i1:34-903(-)
MALLRTPFRRFSSSSFPPFPRVSTPNPAWKAGDKVQVPFGTETSSFDASSFPSGDIYRMMIGLVVPRPIAFVSTVDEKGVVNLAPFSFFNAVSSNPPTLMFSVTKNAKGGKKDTLINIEKTKQFVVNTVAEWMVEPANFCSIEFPYGVSEMSAAGLTAVPSIKVKPPRCLESPAQLECSLFQTVEIGEGVGSATAVFGKIECIHLHQSVIKYEAREREGARREKEGEKGEKEGEKEGKEEKKSSDPGEKGKVEGKRITISLDHLRPIARLDGLNYSKLGEIFWLKRPKL